MIKTFENFSNDRKLGEPLSKKIKEEYIHVYRACKIEVFEFYDKDYVTLSKKFAIEHAENNHVYHEEAHHVIVAFIKTSDLYEAYNPGEYFYSGDNIKGKEIYISKGPFEYEN